MVSKQLSLMLEEDVALEPNIILFGDSRWDTAIEEWKKTDIFGCDIETFGEGAKDGLDAWKGKIRIISIGLPSGKVLVVNLGGFNDNRLLINKKLSESGFFDLLKERLLNPLVKKVGQNFKFDQLFFLTQFGFECRNVVDVMLMSQIYWAGLSAKKHGFSHSLGAIADRLGIEVDKTEQKSDWGWDLNNKQLNYAAKDSLVVLKIYKRLGEKLDALGLSGAAKTEFGASPVFAHMEYYGMPVDMEELSRVIKAYQDVEAEIILPFEEEFPGINPDSPKQVVAAINDRYKIQLSGSGVEELSYHYDKPALKSLSVWRSLRTYIEYLTNIEKLAFGGRVRSNYRQMGQTGFGRSTSSNPNLQNPPNPNNMPDELKAKNLPSVRSIFKPKPGRRLLVADLSQSHARLGTELSQDPILVKSYNENLDIHCITAATIAQLQKLGDDWTADNIKKWRKDKSHPNQEKAEFLRTIAKPLFYGSLNSQGAATLQRTVRTEANTEISIDEAKQAITAWRETYKGLYNLQREIHRKANEYEVTFPGVRGIFAFVRGGSGRCIVLEKFKSDYSDKPQCKITDAVAFVWTSTEADIVKLAMYGILNEIDQHPEWEAYICNMAHDELDLECNEEYALDVAKVALDYMQGAMQVFIKSIPVDDADSKPSKLLVNSWADK